MERSISRAGAVIGLILGAAVTGCASSQHAQSIVPAQDAARRRFVQSNGGMTISVPAKDPYTDTGISVSANQQLGFDASGHARWARSCQTPRHPGCMSNPDGIPYSTRECRKLQRSKLFGPFEAPGLACFSLIGKIGTNGTPFEVGKQLDYTVPATVSGELYLGFNDNYYKDNRGSFKVNISD